MSATTTRRRRLAFFIKSEFDASDGTLRVPAHHRGPVAAGARVRGPRHGALHHALPGLGGRTAPPKGPHHRPGRRARGSRPDLVQRDSHRQ